MDVLENELLAAQEAVDNSCTEDPGRVLLLDQLSRVLADMFIETHRPEYVDRGIDVAKAAIEATLADDFEGLAERSGDLGLKYIGRWRRSKDACDLDHAISLLHTTVENLPRSDTSARSKWMRNYSLSLQLRHSVSGDKKSYDDALEAELAEVDEGDTMHPQRHQQLHRLAATYYVGYERFRDVADLEKSIRTSEQALDLAMRVGADELASYHDTTGALYEEKWEQTKDLSDLEESIRLAENALSLGPHSTENESLYTFRLASRLDHRYASRQNLKDLSSAIDLMQRSLALTPHDNEDFGGFSIILQRMLYMRYIETKREADLRESISVGKMAISVMDENHKYHSECMNILGAARSSSFQRTGKIQDLDEAVAHAKAALKSTKDEQMSRQSLANLCKFYLLRYEATGTGQDVDRAIEHGQSILQATPKDDRRLGALMSQVAFSLYTRYKQTSTTEDIQAAMAYSEQAMSLLTRELSSRSTILSTRAIILGTEYLRTQKVDVLDEAIRLGRESVELLSEDHGHQSTHLNNLSNLYDMRYQALRAPEDLDEVISLGRRSVQAAKTRQERSYALVGLATGCFDRYTVAGSFEDAREAIECFKTVLYDDGSDALSAMNAATKLLSIWTVTFKNWQQAFKAAKHAIEVILPRLTQRSLDVSDKRTILGRICGVTPVAAAVALQAEEGAEVCLELLEKGRCVLAASIQEMRSDVTVLEREYPELAARLARSRERLAQSSKDILARVAEHIQHPTTQQEQGTQVLEGPQQNRLWVDRETHDRYTAAQEYTRVLHEIQSLSGFKTFTQQPSIAEMQEAARRGPIVVINVAQIRCDAILVLPDRIEAVPLPLLQQELGRKQRIRDLSCIHVLEWLWDAVAEPVLARLGLLQQPASDGDRQQVWWVPTGSLTRFPLHAAGYHLDGSGRTVMDRCHSSYASSVRSLLHTRQRTERLSSFSPSSTESSPSPAIRALLVSMEYTPGRYSCLPFAEEEVHVVQDICAKVPCNVDTEVLSGGRRRHKQDVISRLPGCDIYHFAGHASTDLADPLKSHMVLEDVGSDPLSIADLLDLNLQQNSGSSSPPFLAYLSACGTSQLRGDSFFDESIHLVSACQLAGFRHVIGTLWEVEDEICVDVARIAYGDMLSRGRLTDNGVCKGLHKAAIELRDRWVRDSKRVQKWRGRQGTRSGRDHRDVVSSDDDDDVSSKAADWVAYVHYGV